MKVFAFKPRNLILISLTFLTACAASSASPKPDKSKQTLPVEIATVEQKTVPLQLRAMGSVEAYSVVSVKSQINGELTGVYFTEGEEVKQGDLLFKIDSRSLEAAKMQAEATLAKDLSLVKQAEAKRDADTNQIRQAEAKLAADIAQVKQAEAKRDADIAQIEQAKANLTKDTAQAKQASLEAQRYAKLLSEGAISRNQYDQLQTTAETSQASSQAGSASVDNAKAVAKASSAAVDNALAVLEADRAAIENVRAAVEADNAAIESAKAVAKADSAAVDNAKVQLSYTSIFAPISGRTGSLQVNKGNLIKANDTSPLVVINQINPIYVNFSIPQQQLNQLKSYAEKNQLKVTAIIPKDEEHPLKGELSFIDNAIDNATGTVKLKAVFDNPNAKLWPGLFVNVIVELEQQSNATVVPTQAVQTGQKGKYVFVLNPDKTVEYRAVTVRRTFNQEALIETGLKPGEKVVTDGHLKLVPGAKVSIKNSHEKAEKDKAEKKP